MNRRDFASMTIGALLAAGIFFCFIHFSPKDEYTRLLVSFSSSNMPIIETKIGNIDSYLGLDLGSKLELKLDSNVLSKLEKRPGDPTRWRDLKGNRYEAPSYILSQIKIGSLERYRVSATEDIQEFHDNTLLWSENQEQKESIIHRGILGYPLLKNRVLFLDFPRKAMVICSKLRQLDREEISPSEWRKIPLEISPYFGIILSVETDLGPQRFALDTGCTVTLIRTPQLEELLLEEEIHGIKNFMSSKFSFDGEEFGPKRLYFFDITPELFEDGILGMDFLSRHRIVLDLPHQTAYIEPVIQ